MGSTDDLTRIVSRGLDKGGREEGLDKRRVKDEVDRGGMVDSGFVKERRDGLVVVSETATVMVCMRLVRLKVAEHFSFRLNIMFTSFTSAFTSLSIVFACTKLRVLDSFDIKEEQRKMKIVTD